MMTPKTPSDQDPEKPDQPTEQDPEKKPQAATRKFKATPAFDMSDEDEINEMRKAMIDQEAEDPKVRKLDDMDPFFKAVDPLPEQDAPEQTEPRAGEPGNTQDAMEDDLTQRINALRIENTQPLLSQAPVTPPFVMDELFGLDESTDTLPDKIRRGQVPPETLQLLITQSMSEAEVVAVSRELGVDWNLTPGKNREEKIQFLVDYFRHKDNSTDSPGKAVHEASKPIFLTRNAADDWRESDSRLQALQETLNLPDLQASKQKFPIFTRLKDDFDQSSQLAKGLIIGLSVFAIILTVVILYSLFTVNNKGQPTPQPSATAPNLSDVPFPKMVQFPGGWAFNLQVGLIKNGSWEPISAEWLQGTEVCRLVSLPWSKQLNAVLQTLTAGDEILLSMSNQDILSYKVETTKTIKVNELDQLTNRDSPCLIVILTQKETDERQVIIAAPNFSSNVEATPAPIKTTFSASATVEATGTAMRVTETPGTPQKTATATP